MRKSSRIPFQMPGRAAGKGRRPHFPEQKNCRDGNPLVLENFILPYGKSLWISFSQVSNFILHPVTIFIVWQPIIYIFFMILHCFEQIMQFRYFVPAAAYSKDKYRLLFRESRVPAFFSRFIAGGESDAGISIRGNLREAVTNSPGTFLLLRAGTARLQQGHFLALRAQGATPCGAMRKTPMCRRMAHGGLKTFRRTGLPFSFAGALLRRRPRGTRGRLTDGSRP